MTAFFVGLDTAIALFKRWRWLLLALPLLALAVQTWRLNETKRDLEKARATIAQMETASKAAQAAQIALNATSQDLLERIADNAQTRHVEATRAADSAVAAYAAAHRLHPDCYRSTGRTDHAPVRDDPGAPDSPDAVNVVAVPRSDFEALAKDALQGAEARAFLIDLANEGLGVVVWPEPEIGR